MTREMVTPRLACDGTFLFLVGQDLAEGDAGGIVNADMDELPTCAAFTGSPVIALAGAIAGDAMADAVETAKLLDIDVDHVARLVTLISTRRLCWLKIDERKRSADDVSKAYGGCKPERGTGAEQPLVVVKAL